MPKIMSEEDDPKAERGDTQMALARMAVEQLQGRAVWRQTRREWWMRSKSDQSMVWTLEDQEGVGQAVAEVVFSVRPAAAAGTVDAVKRLVKLKLNVPESVWDRHPWLLPCANGVLDLHTQTLLDDPSPELYITKVAPAAYDPLAKRDLVEAHVKMLFDGDDALVHCFQKQVGAALVGNAETEKPQVFVVLIGPSGGGKGTVTHALSRAFGTYVSSFNAGDFTKKKTERHLAWMRDFDGVRLAIIEELKPQPLDVGLVKKLSGGDTLVANEMRMADSKWVPSHTMFFTSNTAPNFDGDVVGMERRYVPLPTGPKRQDPDGTYIKRVLDQSEGWLAWAVEGTRMWLEEDSGGLIALPDRVVDLRNAHIVDDDPFAGFIQNWIHVHPMEFCWRNDVHMAYQRWLVSQGNYTVLAETDPRWKALHTRLDMIPGATPKRSNSLRGWNGIGIHDLTPEERQGVGAQEFAPATAGASARDIARKLLS